MDLGSYHLCAIDAASGGMGCWGQNTYGQSRPPSSAFLQVSAYDYHTCALNTTGFPICWGASYIQYANYTSSPAAPPAVPLATLSTGSRHACGVATNGSVLCWGADDFHQSSAPQAQFLSVAAGFQHTCGITYPDQRVVCWGNCDRGECVAPNATTTPYIQVSAGDRYSCGVTAANVGVCWGRDLPTYNYTQVPQGLQYSFVGASKTGAFSCGLLVNGTAVCWGDKFSSLNLVPSMAFSSLALGTRQVCGVTKSVNTSTTTTTAGGSPPGGTLVCFGVLPGMVPPTGFQPKQSGYCYRPTIGFESDTGARNATLAPWWVNSSNATADADNDTITFPPMNVWTSDPNDSKPTGFNLTLASYSFRKVEASGNQSACGIAQSGQAYCWGKTSLGGAAAAITNAVDITASLTYDVMCALKVTGAVTCSAVSVDATGQMISSAYAPPQDAFVSLSAKGTHVCSLKTNGRIKCWGFNDDGQIFVPDLTYLYVATGAFHTCAITTTFDAVCWGRDDVGQTSRVPRNTKYRALACGYAFCCGIRLNDAVDCWGSNAFGESNAPRTLLLQIATGWSHTCAVTTDWTLRCWGNDSFGQTSGAPAGLYYHVSAGRTHSCATAVNGSVVCWGDVARNQLAPAAALAQPFTGVTTDQMVAAVRANNSRTRMQCSTLSWGIDLSTNLCTNAATFPACVPPSNYAGAVARCAAMGGRLPTVTEQRAGWLATALCNFADGWIWTSTTCLLASGQPGVLIASDATRQRKCADASTATVFPICVSENEFSVCTLGSHCDQVCVPQPDASTYACTCDAGFVLGSDGTTCSPALALRSTSTCKQLGLSLVPATKVCAVVSKCSTSMTYLDARAYCRARGARLPTRQEVLGRKSFPLQCSMAVWTSTGCAAGLNSGYVATTVDYETCANATTLAAAICVADPDINECTLGMHSCTEHCWNTEGSYTCTCDDNEALVATGTGSAVCQSIATPAQSTASCKQLQWTNIQSDSAICSSTTTTASKALKCPGAVNYTTAAAYCAVRGARLPILSELTTNMDVLSSTNECGYGQKLLWSATTCSRDQVPTIGVAAAGAGPQLMDKLTCLTPTMQLAYPVCVADKFVGTSRRLLVVAHGVGCADVADGFRCLCGPTQRLDTDGFTCVDAPPPLSPLACSSLPQPWTTPDDDDVGPCARSYANNNPTTCSGLVTYAKAMSYCAANGGARLPTLEEITADVALGSGCNLDYSEVWTSSACFDATGTSLGVVTAGGSRAGLAYFPPTCTNTTTVGAMARVRCVRDRGPASNRCTPDACSQLCYNQDYGYACACQDGFQLLSDGTTCAPSTQVAATSQRNCTWFNLNSIVNATCAARETNCAAKAKGTFAAANASCVSQAKRLPTAAEVLQGALLATTCTTNRVWTATRCTFFDHENGTTSNGWLSVAVGGPTQQPVCMPSDAAGGLTASCVADIGPAAVSICVGKCSPDQTCLVSGKNSTSCVCGPGTLMDTTGACQPYVAPLSNATCSSLCWNPSNGVCTNQQVGPLNPFFAPLLQLYPRCTSLNFQQCVGPQTATGAASLCQQLGARLPSIFEVRMGFTPTLTCATYSPATRRIWTSTSCRNVTSGFVGVLASGTLQWVGPDKEVCLASTASSQLAQCVADHIVDPCKAGTNVCAQACLPQPPNGAYACACNDGNRLGAVAGSCSVATVARSAANCSALAWSARAPLPGKSTRLCANGLVQRVFLDANGAVVPSSALPYVSVTSVCSGPVAWSVADSLCRALNARLPTMNEVVANRVANAGCPDSAPIWTSTPCRPGDAAAADPTYMVQAAGATAFANQFPTRCVANTTTLQLLAHARCVADVS
ncbi:Aste57867_16657 [Aphanomyces stellatus]|uniref:non-specific serine/threonine protein kinase n=1 Tax=Aphanomyces stellatus TaxID=120398 RepID=A0A485L5Z4_9STRA|nr:hypothetical protein As57867_016600 [Aphanomyces stellatus]VFT93428.1 Aste57867_16657 [Aphanomyces stellatus]